MTPIRKHVASLRGQLNYLCAAAADMRTNVDPSSLAFATRGWRSVGWCVAIAAIAGGGLWTATARLDGAAIAPGVLVVESSRKNVAHLEGGIVRRILVADGDLVAAGQALIQFDDTYARATLDLMHGQQSAAQALRARLLAEREGRAEIDFPDSLLQRADEPAVAGAILVQVDAFAAQNASVTDEVAVIDQRISKWHGEAAGLNRQKAAAKRRLALMREELANNEAGLKSGVVARNRVLALGREVAEQEGEMAELDTGIASARQAVAELQAQRRLPSGRRDHQVAEQLQSVQAQLADLQEKLYAAEDILRRTRVLAPVAGRIVGLRVHTEGGIVQPGELLMDLVPESDRLIVDLRVHPRDRDIVHAGMAARIRLTAFNARETPLIDGTVVSVSADRLTDTATGAEYFTARVVPDQTSWDQSGRPAIMPGMQAEAYLVTGERTVLDYLLEPLSRGLERAGRET